MKGEDIIPYNDPRELAKFLDYPQVQIAELITGALASGKSEAILMGGRLLQGFLKGTFIKQFAREIRSLQKRGRIEEDYTNKKFGFQTLVELFAYLDKEVPDEDRFKAMKALFYSIVDKNASGDEILKYQLFQIAKRLNSSHLLTLKAAYELRKRGEKPTSAESWRRSIAKEIGHDSMGLVINGETVLVSEGLIGETTHSDNSGIRNVEDTRLTDSGIKLVDLIIKYENFTK